jgi:recombination protein RecT
MKAAWLAVQSAVDRNNKPAIEVCTKNSIANALFYMVVLGLNPSKSQCYFICYGDKLLCQRSYFGTMHIAKTVDPTITDIVADIVYNGDVFEYTKLRGKKVVTKHDQKLENIKKEQIVGAYCSIFRADGSEDTTIMTIDEITQAWKQSAMSPIDEKGAIKPGSTHGKFTAEMAKKTVINRACKPVINSSDDSSVIIKAVKEMDADIAEVEAQETIDTTANTVPLEIDESTGEVTYIQQSADESDLP